jgi:hypothetical protein
LGKDPNNPELSSERFAAVKSAGEHRRRRITQVDHPDDAVASAEPIAAAASP